MLMCDTYEVFSDQTLWPGGLACIVQMVAITRMGEQ